MVIGGFTMVAIDLAVPTLVVAAVILLGAASAKRGRVGLVLLAGGLFTLLVALAVGINAQIPIALDTSVAEWYDAHRTRRRDVEASGLFGYIGRPIHVVIPAVISGALLAWRAKSVVPLLCVAGGVGVGVVVEGTLKAIVERTVTTEPLLYYAHSYPSGHVTGTSALLGTIAVCVAAGPGAGWGRKAKAGLGFLVVAGVVAVAALALYTGAHTCTDVIGGMLLGGAIVAACAAVLPARTPLGLG